MFYSDDPHRDFDRYEAARERRLKLLPVCSECGEPIQSETYYEFDDGKCICPECLEENHRRFTEDYPEE